MSSQLTLTEVDVYERIRSEVRRHDDPERPWFYVNMISSIDGATASDGVSGGLGGPADQAVFGALRAQADVIIAGAQTVRSERYRPPQTSPQHQSDRLQDGQSPLPLIVIITASAKLDPELPLFSDPDYRPLIVTGAAADGRALDQLEGRAEIIKQQSSSIDLELLAKNLAERGHRRCLVEGGPSINGQFIAEGLVDEWNATLAASLNSGVSHRAAHGPAPEQGQAMDLVRLWLADNLLFARWLRRNL